MLPSRTEWKLPFRPLERRIMDARLLCRLSEPDFLRPGIMGPTGGWPERRVTSCQFRAKTAFKQNIEAKQKREREEKRRGGEAYIRSQTTRPTLRQCTWRRTVHQLCTVTTCGGGLVAK